MIKDFNPWCSYCVERKLHTKHEEGANQALHLEREHGYNLLGSKYDPLEAPYALTKLHNDLHKRGEKHIRSPKME